MLALPSLAQVPRAYTIPGDTAATAAVAAALLDAGLIGATTRGRAPAEVLQHGLKQWLDRQLHGCRRIHLGHDVRAKHDIPLLRQAQLAAPAWGLTVADVLKEIT